MQKEKNSSNAVLIYFVGLIIMVIVNMTRKVEVLDIIYLIALVCAVIKYFMIIKGK